MKKVVLVLGFLFISLSGHAQDQIFKEDVKKLVKMTLDTSTIDMMKDAIIYDMKDGAKEKMIKDYNEVVTTFFNELENYYIAQYTHVEVKEMIRFYETPVGRKFLLDKKGLFDNEFPKGKEWDKKLDELSKKYKELKKS